MVSRRGYKMAKAMMGNIAGESVTTLSIRLNHICDVAGLHNVPHVFGSAREKNLTSAGTSRDFRGHSAESR